MAVAKSHMTKKEARYFIVLVLCSLIAISAGLVFRYEFKGWLITVSALVLIVWNKDVITGKGWRGKKISSPIKPATPQPPFDLEADILKYPLADESVRTGYMTLSRLSAKPAKHPVSREKFFNNLRELDGHDIYGTTLNYVMEELEERDEHFMSSLDWKTEVENLGWRVEQFLEKSGRAGLVTLPDASQFDGRTSVSNDGVFELYGRALEAADTVLAFIDTKSDEYVVFLHLKSDTQEAREAVGQIGYGYLDYQHFAAE